MFRTLSISELQMVVSSYNPKDISNGINGHSKFFQHVNHPLHSLPRSRDSSKSQSNKNFFRIKIYDVGQKA